MFVKILKRLFGIRNAEPQVEEQRDDARCAVHTIFQSEEADEIPLYEKLDVCKEQMIFRNFVDMYYPQLCRLRENPTFIRVIRKIREHVNPAAEFCRDNNDEEMKKFKARLIEVVRESKVSALCPEIAEIAEDVKKKGVESRGRAYSVNSAYISIYYALWYLELEGRGRRRALSDFKDLV